MPWQKTTLATPIPDALDAALAPVADLVGAISPLLSTVQSLLDIAKVFVIGQVDPFSALVGTGISALEEVTNDLFGAGVFTLAIDPFDIEGVQRYDVVTGFPILTPGQAIRAMIDSFDDFGDVNRPVFSNSANVTAFGVMVTAPSVNAFVAALEAMRGVFEWPDLEWKLQKARRYVEPPTPPLTVSPDWRSLRVNSFGPFADIQKQFNRQLRLLRGYLTTGDNFLDDLIDSIQQKVDILVAQLALIEGLLGAVSRLSGVYFFDCPPGVGGVDRLKRLLRDPKLSDPCQVVGYTSALLVVGGGPSLTPVNMLREAFR